ncbi:MAG TPA: hypothetical protein ENH82_20060 [bacterium]|nr:hypothetical protein [bacterium]
MVRPIEITDAMSKAQEVGRMQQNAEMRPEAAQAFQKTLSDKLHAAEVHSPNPTPATDQVLLHNVDEQEREKRETAEDQEHEQEEHAQKDGEEPMKENEEDDKDSSGHIDVKA